MDRATLVIEDRPRDARLVAAEHLESERERRCEVIAGEAHVRGEISRLTLRAVELVRVEHDREADVTDQATLVGDHEVATGAQHSRELAERACDVGEMDERDRAYNEVDGVVRKRQLMKVGVMELAPRHLLPSNREHPGRRVDADDRVP